MPLHPVQPMPLPPAQPWPADRHPTASARSATLDDLQPVLDLLADPAVTSRIAAIGECGLDFSPHVLEASLSLSLSRGTGDGQPAAATTAATTAVTGSTSSKKKDPARHDHIKAVQRQIFQAHIDASQRLHIPLNVHSRSAGHHALSQLAASQPHQGALLHAFDGKPSYAVQAAAMQALHDFPSRLMFSVAPIVVRDAGMQAWVKMVPLDALVIETDAPALASVKGARNSVRNASEAVAAVADIKGVDVGTVRQVTTENAARLFPAVRAYLESHHSWTSDTFT
ncbi:hypothetical protein BC831DRAFT_451246 [Entophlyctis helioformis]|nr:hypothetical protein BC831DRAFT_485407 [Entophlyctis helioformis]KAI8927838.1 hypothetical protein BC831DRAFT_451246 [Entophlyctis helioformis]